MNENTHSVQVEHPFAIAIRQDGSYVQQET